MSSYVYNTACIYVHSIGSKYIEIKDAKSYPCLSNSSLRFRISQKIFSSHPSILPQMKGTHNEPSTSPWSLVIRRSRSSHRPLRRCDTVRHGATFRSGSWLLAIWCRFRSGCDNSCLSCLAPGHPCHPFRETDGVVEGSLAKRNPFKKHLYAYSKKWKHSMFLRPLRPLSPLSPLSPLIRKRSLTSLLLWGLLNETEGESKPIKDCSPSVDLDGPLVTMKGLKGPKSRRSWRQKIARRNPNV